MNSLQNHKIVAVLPAAAGTSAVTLTADMNGYDAASFTILRATNAATTFASVLKVEESDDNTSFSSVTGLTGGTDFTIPAVADTSNTAVVKIDVDAKVRKRYLKVTATPSASIAVAIEGRLGRAEVTPVVAADANVIGWVKG
jgi:hypothetical protein